MANRTSPVLNGCIRRCQRTGRPGQTAAQLFLAIVLTYLVAVLMCAFGWLVTPISVSLIIAVWVYNLVWMFLLGGARLLAEQIADFPTSPGACCPRRAD
jgi:hypothetical protein